MLNIKKTFALSVVALVLAFTAPTMNVGSVSKVSYGISAALSNPYNE